MNIQYLKNFIQSGGNINNIIQQISKTNPMINNLLKTSKEDPKAIETFVKNYCNERGINYEEKYNEFINQLSSKN